MDLQAAQDLLNVLYQGDDSTPTEGSTDWNVRLALLNSAIRTWNREKGVLWNELWTRLSDAATGDTTILAATVDYDAPDDFRFPGAWVRVQSPSGDNTFYEVIKPETAEKFANSSVPKVFFDGNKSDGFRVHFLQQPTTGYTIEYPYYRTAAELSDDTDLFEMDDAEFAVYLALSKLQEQDGDVGTADVSLATAEAKLEAMKTMNIMPAWYQDNKIEDRDLSTGRGGFGT